MSERIFAALIAIQTNLMPPPCNAWHICEYVCRSMYDMYMDECMQVCSRSSRRSGDGVRPPRRSNTNAAAEPSHGAAAAAAGGI